MSTAFSNLGLSALVIAFTLPHLEKKRMPVSKVVLLTPFVTNIDLLSYLAHQKVTARSLEKIVIENPLYFSNFNERFYDSLVTSLNAIQLLVDIEAVIFSEGEIALNREVEFHHDMGKRAKKIYSAASNLAILLNDSLEKLYLNLRIEV